ncbi:hypothetical protein NIM87_18320 [Devosia sp. XJ19-1]|uniref:Uncharacterized protein n=1 Tax=Devosia ureilytica TaxID=2952754 RepID=A0A9Q4ARE7_9HYPH|nr:hypothetical protein [Devosia ureilytica]MCP8885462.1 hypothetical protein [Devosia ureilytica]MCP8889054.1 hypothetical protein [Devosia ureilytica]
MARILLVLGLATFADGLGDTGLLRQILPFVGALGACLLIGILFITSVRSARRALLYSALWLPFIVTGLSRLYLDIAPGHAAPRQR